MDNNESIFRILDDIALELDETYCVGEPQIHILDYSKFLHISLLERHICSSLLSFPVAELFIHNVPNYELTNHKKRYLGRSRMMYCKFLF